MLLGYIWKQRAYFNKFNIIHKKKLSIESREMLIESREMLIETKEMDNNDRLIREIGALCQKIKWGPHHLRAMEHSELRSHHRLMKSFCPQVTVRRHLDRLADCTTLGVMIFIIMSNINPVRRMIFIIMSNINPVRRMIFITVCNINPVRRMIFITILTLFDAHCDY